MAHPLLFTPLSMRGVTLPNRIVVAPMHQYSAVRGFANDWHLMNAGRYAAGGAGFVMMESTKVERRGCGTLGDLGLWDDAFIPGLAASSTSQGLRLGGRHPAGAFRTQGPHRPSLGRRPPPGAQRRRR
jgi:2,4-dienoyl-CoA reductase-like NADH-dependent reductase (Old Yellow Enzyme family)